MNEKCLIELLTKRKQRYRSFVTPYNYLDLQQYLSEITNLKTCFVNKKHINFVVWLQAKNDVISV
jgi:hypothetical protein